MRPEHGLRDVWRQEQFHVPNPPWDFWLLGFNVSPRMRLLQGQYDSKRARGEWSGAGGDG